MNKKILIPIIVGILVIVIGMSIIFVGKNKKTKSDILTKNIPTVEKNTNQEKISTDEKKQEKNTINNVSSSDILTFEKENGIIRLYNSKGELLDSLDLKMFDIGEFNESKNEDNKKDESKEENEDEDSDYAYIKTSDGMIATKVEDGKVVIYDKDGKVIQSIVLSNTDGKLEEKKEDKEEKKEDISKNANKLLNAPIKTTFTNFRTINNELVFRDNERNALIEVKAQNEKIIANLLIKNINLKKLNSVYITEENLYFTFKDDTNISKVSRNTEHDEDLKLIKYDVKAIPNLAIFKDDYIYYSTPTKIGKYDINVDKNNLLEIEVGDITSDICIKDNILYAINEFGRGKNNSVLMKINMDNLEVEGIMELKGINSKFIGIYENLAFIRQKDSIKEIDLVNFKPKTARERKEGIPVQVKDNVLYILKNGKLEKVNLLDNKKIDSFNAEGFSIHLDN